MRSSTLFISFAAGGCFAAPFSHGRGHLIVHRNIDHEALNVEDVLSGSPEAVSEHGGYLKKRDVQCQASSGSFSSASADGQNCQQGDGSNPVTGLLGNLPGSVLNGAGLGLQVPPVGTVKTVTVGPGREEKLEGLPASNVQQQPPNVIGPGQQQISPSPQQGSTESSGTTQPDDIQAGGSQPSNIPQNNVQPNIVQPQVVQDVVHKTVTVFGDGAQPSNPPNNPTTGSCNGGFGTASLSSTIGCDVCGNGGCTSQDQYCAAVRRNGKNDPICGSSTAPVQTGNTQSNQQGNPGQTIPSGQLIVGCNGGFGSFGLQGLIGCDVCGNGGCTSPQQYCKAVQQNGKDDPICTGLLGLITGGNPPPATGGTPPPTNNPPPQNNNPPPENNNPPPQNTNPPPNGQTTNGGSITGGITVGGTLTGGTPPPVEQNQPDTNGTSSGNQILDQVNAMRAKWSTNTPLSPYTWSQTLYDNSKTTVSANGGTSMVHQLLPGTNGQVLAEATNIDTAMEMWLCEIMQGFCTHQTSGIGDDPQGHAKLFQRTDFKNIGCFQENQIFGCDLGND